MIAEKLPGTTHPLLTIECPVTDRQNITLILWMTIAAGPHRSKKREVSFRACVLHWQDLEKQCDGIYTTVPLTIPPEFGQMAKVRTAIDQSRDFMHKLFCMKDHHLKDMKEWYTQEDQFKDNDSERLPYDPLIEGSAGTLTGEAK
jgi:hypothetical protein